MNASGGKGKQLKGSDVLEELTMELRHLRSQVRDVGENFILRREGEVETLISYLSGLPAAKLKGEGVKWLREIQHLKLKPAKGRLKDIKGIDELLEKLLEQIIEAHDPVKPSPSLKAKSDPKVVG